MPEEVCRDFSELSGCIDSEWSKMDFISFDRSKFTAKGHYILWDTKKLENYLIEVITANGSLSRPGRGLG